MYAKFKTNLIGLSVALGFALVGYAVGEPPMASQAIASPEAGLALADDADAGKARRGALKRHLAMPYVSLASMLPRRES
jgi:hypothetical protein